MLRLLLGAVLGVVMISCGKGGIGNPFGSSDPLDGQPDYIRNAKPGGQKGNGNRPTEADMPISSNQSYFLFYEGISGEAQLTGRVLKDGYRAELSIQNISEFPGATFDPATGVIRWTPATGIVPESEDQIEVPLRVRMLAISADGAEVQSRTKDFPVFVRKMGVQPAIVRDNLTVPFVREGTRESFEVTVQYRGVANQPKAPDLRVLISGPVSSYDNDLSKYVSQDGNPTQDRNDPKKWVYRFTIDLYNVDLTKNSSDYKFQISFQNPEAIGSTPREYSLQVRTDLQAIKSTLNREVIRVKQGATLTKDVVFYDPRDEGYVFAKIETPAVLPEGMTVDCREGDTNSMQICSVIWAVPATVAVDTMAELSFRVDSRSQAVGDNLTLTRSFNMSFQVVAP